MSELYSCFIVIDNVLILDRVLVPFRAQQFWCFQDILGSQDSGKAEATVLEFLLTT